MGSYSDFESDRSAVGRLRRRASGEKGALPIHEMAEWGIRKMYLTTAPPKLGPPAGRPVSRPAASPAGIGF